MLHHQIHVHAPVAEVLRTLNRADFASAMTDDTLHVVQLSDAVGAAYDRGGETKIDLFDEDDGVQVARLVAHLRADGLVVDQETLD